MILEIAKDVEITILRNGNSQRVISASFANSKIIDIYANTAHRWLKLGQQMKNDVLHIFLAFKQYLSHYRQLLNDVEINFDYGD